MENINITRYDADWIYGMNPDSDGRYIKLEQAEQALRQAVEALAAAGRRADAQELRETQLERHRYSTFFDEDYGWSASISADPDGEYASAREVARHLRTAAQQLSRSGHWAAADKLLQLVGQLGPRGE